MKFLRAKSIIILLLSPAFIYSQFTFGIQTNFAVNNSQPAPKTFFLPAANTNFTLTYQKKRTFVKLDYGHANSQSFIVDGNLDETLFSYYSCSIGRIVSRKGDSLYGSLLPSFRWNIGFELKNINSYDNLIVSTNYLQYGMRFGIVGEIALSVPINNYLSISSGLNSQVDLWKRFTYNFPNQVFLGYDALFFQIEIHLKELLSNYPTQSNAAYDMIYKD